MNATSPVRARLQRACVPALVILVITASGGAWAQPLNRPLNQPSGVSAPTFTRVEQTIGDVDALGTSLRYYSTDLRLPVGFRDVYRIEGSGGPSSRWGVANPTGADLFARRDGAITAVFPQSVYINTRDGVAPLIPPGTIFFIGDLPSNRFSSLPPAPDSPDRVDTRVDTRAATTSVTPATPGVPSQNTPAARSDETPKPSTRPIEKPPEPPGIMTDELLRRRTVRELIMKVVDQPAPKPADVGPVKPAPAREESGAQPEKKQDAPRSDPRRP